MGNDSEDSKIGNDQEEFKIKNEAVQSIWEILNDCRELHPGSSEDGFLKLEWLLAHGLENLNGNKKDLIEKLNGAHSTIKELKKYSNRCEEYYKLFRQLEDYLGKIQEEFINTYHKNNFKNQYVS